MDTLYVNPNPLTNQNNFSQLCVNVWINWPNNFALFNERQTDCIICVKVKVRGFSLNRENKKITDLFFRFLWHAHVLSFDNLFLRQLLPQVFQADLVMEATWQEPVTPTPCHLLPQLPLPHHLQKPNHY